MPQVSIRRAEGADDLAAIRALCRDWVDWQLATLPEHREAILTRFEPVAYARELDELPVIHARPRGLMLLATLDDRPVGCVMYHPHDPAMPGMAEIKRLFVRPDGRGHGIGRALLEAMFEGMRGDGYDRVRFASARFLPHARALYERVGFVDIPALPGTPPIAYWMERAL